MIVLFKIFILLPRIVRDGVPLSMSRAVSNDRIEATHNPSQPCLGRSVLQNCAVTTTETPSERVADKNQSKVNFSLP